MDLVELSLRPVGRLTEFEIGLTQINSLGNFTDDGSVRPQILRRKSLTYYSHFKCSHLELKNVNCKKDSLPKNMV